MLKIQSAVNGEVVLTVSGQMGGENVAELKTLISSEENGRRIVLNLKDVILEDQNAVSFLESCEVDGIELKNCPVYIREWVLREQKRGRATRSHLINARTPRKRQHLRSETVGTHRNHHFPPVPVEMVLLLSCDKTIYEMSSSERNEHGLGKRSSFGKSK